MKILVLTSTFPRWNDDVRPPFVYDLSRGLQKQGFDVFVLAPHCQGAKKFEIMDGMKVYRFTYFYPAKYQKIAYGPGVVPNLKSSILARIELPIFFLSELFNAMKIIRREKIDIINSHWLIPHGIVGVICKKVFRIPNVAIAHGSDVNISTHSRILKKLCSAVIDGSDKVTVNSSYIKKIVLGINSKSVDKIDIIPMGVDNSIFDVHNLSNLKEAYNAKYLIFSVGRLIDWKGMDILIMAMPEVIKKIPEVKLVIGGSGPKKEALKKLVKDLGLEDKVILTGYLENVDMPKYYASADVFVLPSINLNGQTEALGVVLLEAMASGCPVIGSNVGGVPDIIQDGVNGFLVKEKSPADMANSIVEILLNDQIRDKFKINGLKTVNERFLWQKIVQQFADVNSHRS